MELIIYENPVAFIKNPDEFWVDRFYDIEKKVLFDVVKEPKQLRMELGKIYNIEFSGPEVPFRDITEYILVRRLYAQTCILAMYDEHEEDHMWRAPERIIDKGIRRQTIDAYVNHMVKEDSIIGKEDEAYLNIHKQFMDSMIARSNR